MSNNNPVRHHHVPKVYLNNFVDKQGKVAVWDKRKSRLFHSSVAGIAVENNFYTLHKSPDPYAWERTYATGIEPLMGRLFRRINTQTNMLTQSGSQILSSQDKRQLAEIMIVQLLRGKQGREFQEKVFKEQMSSVIAKVERRFHGFTPGQRKEVARFQSDNYYFKNTSNIVITNPQRVRTYTDLLAERDFVIYRLLGDREFLTSDNPVMFINMVTGDATPFASGLLDTDTIIYYPLTPKLLVSASAKGTFAGVMTCKDQCLIDIDSHSEEAFITNINALQLTQCHSQIYAHSGGAIEQVTI